MYRLASLRLLYGELVAALLAAPSQDISAIRCLHPLFEAVCALALPCFEFSLHSLGILVERKQECKKWEAGKEVGRRRKTGINKRESVPLSLLLPVFLPPILLPVFLYSRFLLCYPLMSFRYDSEFVFIGRGDESFLESYTYEREDNGRDKGHLFFAVEILNNQAEAQEIGDQLFETFKTAFAESSYDDPYTHFEEALKKVNISIERLKEEKVSGFIGNLNIAAGAVIDNALYVSTVGDAEIYLVRKRFISIVSEGLSEESARDAFVNIANGPLEAGDIMLFSTSRLLRYVSKADLGKMFDGVPRLGGAGRGIALGDAMTDLQDFVMTEILGRCVVIGVSVSEGSAMLATDKESFADVSESSESIMGKVHQIAERVSALLPKRKSSGPGALSSLRLSIAQMLAPREKKEKKRFNIEWRRSITREKLLVSIIFLVVLLIGGVFWFRTRGSQKQIIAEQTVKLNTVRELINDASTIGQFDKPKAADLLTTAEATSFEVLNSRYLRSEAVTVLDDIKKLRDSLDDVRRVEQPEVLANLADKRGSVNALGILALSKKIFAFEYNALYEIILDQLQDPLTISSLESVILATPYQENNSLLFLTRTGKMIEFADAHFTLTPTQDGIWKKGVDLKTYSDRIYILDPERNQIWRYAQRRGGFGLAEEYNKDAELQNGVSMAIDGFVYILNSDGTITQLYQGERQSYPLKQLPLYGVESPTRIFTTADSAFLYILEPSKSRVLIFRKDRANGGAVYRTQYVFENVGELRDLVVDEDRLYVSDASKVYVVNLAEL